MALSGPLETLVVSPLKEEFYREYEKYEKWFPCPYCPSHREEFLRTKLADRQWIPESCCRDQTQFDKRTPGLFKEEFRGDGIIALNSKTYFCWSEGKSKLSSKGLSKRHNSLTREQYLRVLKDRKPITGVNKGFVYKDHKMLTYRQLRAGLTYFYAKRKVCPDGVSTEPLD